MFACMREITYADINHHIGRTTRLTLTMLIAPILSVLSSNPFESRIYRDLSQISDVGYEWINSVNFQKKKKKKLVFYQHQPGIEPGPDAC